MRVRFTRSGRAQFLAVVSFQRKDPEAARRLRQHSERILRRLPEFPDLPHREVIVPPYRFLYRVVGRSVWVVAV